MRGLGVSKNAYGVQFPLLSTKQGNRRIIAEKASPPSSYSKKIEIRVCTNRTCRKQGSLDSFRVFSEIAPPYATVKTCGCLGRCGWGPNVVILPEGVFVGHCGTPMKVASTMLSIIRGDDDSDAVNKCLKALSLRNRAEEENGRGDFAQACSLLSQAIDLKPFGGVHVMYKDRSVARLGMGDINGALEDVKQALTIAPHYPQAYICEGDVLMAGEQFDAAEDSYSIALELDPSLRRSKSFKARVSKLQEKLSHVVVD